MERKIVIRKSRHFFERYSRTAKTLALAVLVLSIPLTVYVLNQVQDIRQRAAGELIPLTSNFPQTGCPISFVDVPASRDYSTAVYCQNQSYCITSGYDPDTAASLGLPSPSFGGDIKTSRKFAIAFIARYHAKAIPAGDPRHWDMVTPTGNVFTDVKPGAEVLAAEIETAKKYGFISGQDNGDGTFKFDPEGDWVYGFHGIDRSEYFDASGNFKWGALGSITRGEFLKQQYLYGINPAHQDLKLCMIAPTAPPPTAAPPPPTATPVPVIACSSACTTDAQCSKATGGCTVCKPNTAPAPIVDFTKLTGSSCPKNFASTTSTGALREPTYTTAPYRLAVECLNKAYCVVQGYSKETCPPGSSCTDLNLAATPPEGYLGGELPTSRKFAVAFIARYRVDAIAPSDPRHWNWVTPTGNVFKDVPTSLDLGREIETAAANGFITGQSCGSLYDTTELTKLNAKATDACFDPEGNWIFGFKGVLRQEYFNGTTPVDPWGQIIKRGDFLQALYTYGTAASHPDLAKCMSAPGSGGSCQPPAACNVGCIKDGDCAGAKDGCTVCTGATSTTAGKCAPPPAACGSSCSRDADCTGAAARDGCTSCVTGRCAIPFNDAACKCDGIDATAIGSGQAVTFSAFSKVEGTDVSKAIVKAVNIRVFRGGAEVATQIAQSGFLPPTVIENTATKIRYKNDWRYIVPADANNGDLFRVQANIQCAPKVIASAPTSTKIAAEKGIIAKVIDKITEPIRTVLGIADSPTPVPAKSLQINSFYPGEIIEKTCNYIRFVIKK